MVLRRLIAAAPVLASLIMSPAMACEAFDDFDAPAGAVEADGYAARYRFDPETLRPFEPFAVDIAVCGSKGPFTGEMRADADMPAHRHGMNYSPEISVVSPGRFRAEGFLLHMPGTWRFKFDLLTADGPVRLRAAHDAK